MGLPSTAMGSPLPTSERTLAQATGMVSVQADCSIAEALMLIEKRAQSTAWTVGRVARAVVDRQMRFASLDPH
jgi:hypothetical protein